MVQSVVQSPISWHRPPVPSSTVLHMMFEDLKQSTDVHRFRCWQLWCYRPWQDSKEFLTSTSLSPEGCGDGVSSRGMVKACLKMKSISTKYTLHWDSRSKSSELSVQAPLEVSAFQPVLFPFLSLSLVRGVHAHVHAHVPDKETILSQKLPASTRYLWAILSIRKVQFHHALEIKVHLWLRLGYKRIRICYKVVPALH